ncbi:hypothetical protein O6H91_01G038600 [Diphasiastrum complanatum]|uniref:Uncharacterized protein n=1 Tax=Diphasiastrum complanatum TaxID=34168 RepID=A0ACC2EQ17_DIPCM|nr:hypothetical protein O6H91_Y404000 [Diphasiastrum complanatum]KAJ7568578.1 hypothetical protein O6H91_01G038600 [Diphasiastrum complanatum]
MVEEISHGRRRKCVKCCALCCTTTLVVFIVMLIIGLVLFKRKDPRFTVNAVNLQNITTNGLIPPVITSVILSLNVSVKNPNRVSFKYSNTSVFAMYHGVLLAEAPVPAGKIGAQKTERVLTNVTIYTSKISSSPYLPFDIASDVFPVNTSTRLAGRIKIFGIFKKHLVATSFCDITVSLKNQSLENYSCQNNVKL